MYNFVRVCAIVFVLFCLNSIVYSQNTTTNEYNYIYEDNIAVGIEDKENKVLSLIIERRGLPLANRLVRFISPNTDIITFENGEGEVIVPTDDDGKASVYIEPKKIGNSVVVMHMLYVGSSGNTNISQEVYTKVNVFTAVDEDVVAEKKISVFLPIILTPYIFILVLIMYMISYYRRFEKAEKSLYGHIVLGTLLGFSSIRVHFKSMLVVTALELVIVVLSITKMSYIIPLALITITISSFFKKRDRTYSVAFLMFSFLSLFYNITNSFINHSSMAIINDTSKVAHNYVFIFLLFFIITAFFSGIYIPSMTLTLYATLADLNLTGIIIAIVAIYLSSVVYIIKTKLNKDVFIFYTINLLKTRL